jgi:hypothetical protein
MGFLAFKKHLCAQGMARPTDAVLSQKRETFSINIQCKGLPQVDDSQRNHPFGSGVVASLPRWNIFLAADMASCLV